MSNLAESFETLFAVETDHYDEFDCDVVEISSRQHESPTETFFEEIDAWARHSLALNGFCDY